MLLTPSPDWARRVPAMFDIRPWDGANPIWFRRFRWLRRANVVDVVGGVEHHPLWVHAECSGDLWGPWC